MVRQGMRPRFEIEQSRWMEIFTNSNRVFDILYLYYIPQQHACFLISLPIVAFFIEDDTGGVDDTEPSFELDGLQVFGVAWCRCYGTNLRIIAGSDTSSHKKTDEISMAMDRTGD